MNSRVSPVRRLAALATGLLLGAGLLAQPAWADGETAPPVTADDSYSWYAGGSNVLDVLANDSDPQGSPLQVCKVKYDQSPESNIYAFVSDGTVFAGVGSGTGTFSFRYYACNDTFLTPATVTITVRAAEPLRVHKLADRPGRLKVVNHNDRAAHILWGDQNRPRPDGVAWIGAHSSRVITVKRSKVFWLGLVGKENGTAGSGFVRNIALPQHARTTTTTTTTVTEPFAKLWSTR